MLTTDSANPPMKLLRKTRSATAQPKERVTSSEFCQLFTKKMKGLYLLSLLLTASSEMAEQCFVSGLEDCLSGTPVAKEWAYSWAKRVVIKNAIRLVVPHVSCKDFSILREVDGKQQSYYAKNQAPESVLALGDFERIVFVTSVLERYSDRDCAALLDCHREEIRTGRTRALQQIAAWACRTEHA